MGGRKRIWLINTGGTFSMRKEGGGFLPDLAARVPEVAQLAEIEVTCPFQLDSAAMSPLHWQELARLIASRREEFEGIVVIHGTDTMAYTASALSYMLRDLDRPVVLTGAQVPLERTRSDARANLLDAVEVATHAPGEVMICFGGLLLRGNRSRKRSTMDFRAFESPNYPPLGEVGRILELHQRRFRRPSGAFRLCTELDPRVLHLRLAPGRFGSLFESVLDSGVRGIVLESFGAGNLDAASDGAVPTLAALAARGIPVLLIGGCEHGRVELSLYEGGRAAEAAGAIGGADLTAEAAVTKLMVAIARGRDLGEIRAFLARDLAGELTPV
jgi:L-asparaginase